MIGRSLQVALVILATALAALTGCGSGISGVRQAIGSVAIANAAGYRALDVADAAKHDQIDKMITADSEGPIKAQAALDKWKAQRTTVRKVLDATEDAIELAAKLADEYAKNGAPSMINLDAWADSLLSLIPLVVKALSDAGVALPVVLTQPPQPPPQPPPVGAPPAGASPQPPNAGVLQ